MSVLDELLLKSPAGLKASQIEKAIGVSRATVNRLLKNAVTDGRVVVSGKGPTTLYRSADPLGPVRRYFDVPSNKRPVARYDESRLDILPEFDLSRIGDVPAGNYPPLDRRGMLSFLIDFSCASSILEGGTYSLLDTQALLEYGEKAPDKPLSGAVLVLNHKRAFEKLFVRPSLELNDVLALHREIAWDHDIEELKFAPHFLPSEQCGLVREYEDIQISQSAYIPPTRPGTGYIRKMLARVLQTAEKIQDPLQSAFYLMTRLPYLQPFNDGNKRLSRLLANVPLLKAGYPPISFVDIRKKDYLIAMLEFYELGEIKMANKCFCDGYLASLDRIGYRSAH